MGTPDFAETSLRALYEAGYDIAAVISRPDSPKNRGMKLTPSPVKKAALELGLPVYTPSAIKSEETLELLRSFKADVFAVVAYGRILPKSILSIPTMGCVNVHGSLLPKYRGAAPVQWTVLNGDEFGGVTTMLLDEGMDTGMSLMAEQVKVGPEETFGELYSRLAGVGADLLLRTLEGMSAGTVLPKQQDESAATYAPPVTKEMCPIDWNSRSSDIINKIRGLNPSPAATGEIGGVRFKIFRAVPGGNSDKEPGSIVGTDKRGIEIACADRETVIIKELQAPGGKRMAAADYLRGHPLT